MSNVLQNPTMPQHPVLEGHLDGAATAAASAAEGLPTATGPDGVPQTDVPPAETASGAGVSVTEGGVGVDEPVTVESQQPDPKQAKFQEVYGALLKERGVDIFDPDTPFEDLKKAMDDAARITEEFFDGAQEQDAGGIEAVAHSFAVGVFAVSAAVGSSGVRRNGNVYRSIFSDAGESDHEATEDDHLRTASIVRTAREREIAETAPSATEAIQILEAENAPDFENKLAFGPYLRSLGWYPAESGDDLSAGPEEVTDLQQPTKKRFQWLRDRLANMRERATARAVAEQSPDAIKARRAAEAQMMGMLAMRPFF